MSDFFGEFVPSAWQKDGCVSAMRRTRVSSTRRGWPVVQRGSSVTASVLLVATLSIGVAIDARVTRAADSIVSSESPPPRSDTADPAYWRGVSAYIGKLGARPANADSEAPELPDVDP